MFMCWWVGKRRNFPRDHHAHRPGAYSACTCCTRHPPAVLLPVLIVLFLRFGIATPTEVAVLSTLYAGVVSAWWCTATSRSSA